MTRALLWIMPVALMLLIPVTAGAQDSGMAPQALASDTAADISSTAPEYELSPEEDTHPMIRLTPEKSEIIRLDEEARSIIVGNPVNLSVLMDNTKTLILVPQVPGATHFTVLDKSGKVIMQRHVIVASPKEQYLRVRRTCAMAGGACEETSVYYCPDGDMCEPVAVPARATAASALSSLLGGSGGSSSNGSAGTASLPNMSGMMQQLQNSFTQGTTGVSKTINTINKGDGGY
jgi:Flp pilus assembly secretin CpaC